MAWSWSHTSEAYLAVQRNIEDLPIEDLQIIFAEWRAAQSKHGEIDSFDPPFNERKYNRALAYAKTMPDDILAEFIWEKSSEYATCDNGGWNAWICPYGCHTVPFDRKEDDDN